MKTTASKELPTHCLKCNESVIKDGLCTHHFKKSKFNEWLDNTDPKNLGIVKWCHEMMPEFAFDKTPWFHEKLFLDLLKLYNPEYRNKYERLYEFISFRESAKSTAANTLFASYILAHNGKAFKIKVDGETVEYPIDESLIVIISETSTSAEEFTVRIRDAFSTSERLRYYYNVEFRDAIDSITGQWTRSSFKFNDCFVQAVGSGQQIRGKVKGASRPTLVIADDIYSENNTVTEERRARIKYWWNNAVMNSVDNVRGKVLVLGTILHDDTIIVELEKNPQWNTIKIELMPIDKFHVFLEEHIKVDWDISTCYLPFHDVEDKDDRQRKQKAYFNNVQDSREWGLAWPERIDLYLLALKYQECVHNQIVSGLYQEYFHITKSPEDRRFRRDFFQTLPKWEYKWEHYHSWIKISDWKDEWLICQTQFGVDLAGGGKDDAVVTVTATLPDHRILVLHQAIGKFSIRDDASSAPATDLRLNKVILNRDVLRKKGIVDECFRLAIRFHPSRIKVGCAGEEEQVVDLMRQVFQENKNFETYIYPRKQTKLEGRKEERILNTCLPYYETRMVYHDPALSKLEYQLEYLGKSTHDDCADSLECSFYGLEIPENLTHDWFTAKESSDSKPYWRMPDTNRDFDWRSDA